MQFTRPLLLLLTLVLCSFKQDDNAYQGSFTASIDGKPFQVQDDQMFRGLLMNKSASMNGKIPARTVISAIFNGQSYNLTEDKLFTENIQFEMAYTDGMIGQPAYFALAMQYQSGKYFMVKDKSKLNITEFKWEDDKKHFLISGNYDCKMRSWDTPSDNSKDLEVKGTLTNIRITVPSWLAVKN